MPICKLCGNSCSQLMQSHIIPKLVYNRIKTHPQSRFRDYSNIKRPLQDGEKHEMLCHECEEKFSKYETKFATNFLDKYLQSQEIPTIDCNTGWLGNYIVSVAWRIIHDDLYRLNSFDNEWCRSTFEDFERLLHHHLEKNPIPNTLPAEIKNYVFDISKFIRRGDDLSFLDGMLFGYPYYDLEHDIYLVYTFYANLIFATTFSPRSSRVIYLKTDAKFLSTIKSLFLPQKSKIRFSLRNEFAKHCQFIATQHAQNMTPDLRNKIQKYYENKRK